MEKLHEISFFLFLTSLTIQGIYWLYLLKIQRTSTALNDLSPKVSVIVCLHNEAQNLPKLIISLLNQRYSNYNIILVNDRSTDETADIIKNCSSKKITSVNITETPANWDHKKHALQTGINIANGEYLLLTDGDCLPKDTHWVESMIKQTSNHSSVLGASFYKKEKGILNSFIQFETYYTAHQFLGLASQGIPYMGLGRNLLYSKSAFEQSNNLHKHKNHRGGDDDILIQPMLNKLNTTYSLETYTVSTPEKTWTSYFNQKTRHLKSGMIYPLKIKILLFWLLFTHCMVYYTSIFGLFSIHFRIAILFGLLLRIVFLLFKFDSLAKEVGYPIRKRDIILGDILFPVYFPIVGFFSIVLKTVRWK